LKTIDEMQAQSILLKLLEKVIGTQPEKEGATA
jgi:hypothetical protein